MNLFWQNNGDPIREKFVLDMVANAQNRRQRQDAKIIENVLMDLTLIGPSEGAKLREMVYGS